MLEAFLGGEHQQAVRYINAREKLALDIFQSMNEIRTEVRQRYLLTPSKARFGVSLTILQNLIPNVIQYQ